MKLSVFLSASSIACALLLLSGCGDDSANTSTSGVDTTAPVNLEQAMDTVAEEESALSSSATVSIACSRFTGAVVSTPEVEVLALSSPQPLSRSRAQAIEDAERKTLSFIGTSWNQYRVRNSSMSALLLLADEKVSAVVYSIHGKRSKFNPSRVLTHPAL